MGVNLNFVLYMFLKLAEITRSGRLPLLGSLPGTSIEMLFVFAVLFGAVDYSTVPVTASLVARHVGIKMMGLAMGLISAGHAIGGAMGAFLGGYIFIATATYDLVWLGSIWLAVVAGLLVLFIKAQPSPKMMAGQSD